MATTEPAVKPLLRGWSHAVGTGLAIAGTGLLLVLTRQDPPKALSMLIYGVTLILLLSVSAVYHIGHWQPRARTILRSFDHANIFLFIAGSYTAIAFNAFAGWWRIGILASVWLLTAAGVAAVGPSVRLPRWALAALYVGLGWLGVVAIPQIAGSLGPVAVTLVLIGGLLYSTGAAAYAFKRPNPWPRTFGYHELFHLLVLGATASFFACIALYVVPFHRPA